MSNWNSAESPPTPNKLVLVFGSGGYEVAFYKYGLWFKKNDEELNEVYCWKILDPIPF